MVLQLNYTNDLGTSRKIPGFIFAAKLRKTIVPTLRAHEHFVPMPKYQSKKPHNESKVNIS